MPTVPGIVEGHAMIIIALEIADFAVYGSCEAKKIVTSAPLRVQTFKRSNVQMFISITIELVFDMYSAQHEQPTCRQPVGETLEKPVFTEKIFNLIDNV
jgi:hypothetical protein